MSAALELIRTVEANGGQLRVENGWLIVAPEAAAAPVMEELRQHKAEIVGLLKSARIPHLDPAAWAEDVTAWALERCTSRDGKEDCGEIAGLLLDCAKWCMARQAVPPTSAVLVELLQDAGFRCVDGFVSGLILNAHLEAYLH